MLSANDEETAALRSGCGRAAERFDDVLDLIEQLTTIVAAVEPRLTAGLTYGPTLERRLRSSCESLLKAARRDEGVAAALEEAWLEEQGKK